MNLSATLAKHFKEVYFGGIWTAVNLREQATARVGNLNTIAQLVFHMNYYVHVAIKVLDGGKLNARDAESFRLPAIRSQKDWEALMATVFEEAESYALLVEHLPEAQLWVTLEDEKYGSYYRNLLGIIAHCHYHLGQIVLIKKILAPEK